MPPEVKFVLGSGAGGGLVSWAFTLMTGATFGLGPWLALPMCLILGTAASLVGVYVISPTDTKRTGHLMAYALLCGFLWKPVLDAGRVVIGERIDAARAAAGVKEQVSDLKTETNPAQVALKADKAAGNAADLLRSSDTLDNPALEKQATDGATAAVTAISETSTANPEAATGALEEIKDAAEKADNKEVAALATIKIHEIARRLPRQFAPVMKSSPPTQQ